MADSINQYIRYHSEPCSGFVSIKEWNEHFETNLEENEELEYKIMKLRSELGHNEFIPTGSLLKYIRKSTEKSAKSLINNKMAVVRPNYISRHAAKTFVGAFHVNRIRKIANKFRRKKKQDEPADVEQPDAQEEKQQEEEQVEDLDDLLQAEPEYEEEDCHQKCPDGHKEVKHFNSGRRGCKPADVSTPVVNEEGDDGDDGGTDAFQQAVDELQISDAQALNHLIAFVGDHTDIRTRVMKGKARYIEKLQEYLNGDENAQIRTYDGTKKRIANFNPNRESLSKALQSFPSGPHFIECD